MMRMLFILLVFVSIITANQIDTKTLIDGTTCEGMGWIFDNATIKNASDVQIILDKYKCFPSPINKKVENGITASTSPALPMVANSDMVTSCFWADSGVKDSKTPTFSKNSMKFSKETDNVSTSISLVEKEEVGVETNTSYEDCETLEDGATNCTNKTLTLKSVDVSFKESKNSSQVLYCFTTKLKKDSFGRFILPSSNPFNLTLFGKEVDPDPGCGPIILNTSNAIYTMTSNCYVAGATAYQVNGSNVTFDCAGFNITGNNSSSTYGIYSTKFNTTIKNCNIQNFSAGIYFTGDSSDYANITNNTINLTYKTSCTTNTGICNGIYFTGADNASIIGNRIDVYQAAINMYSGTNGNIIEDNIINISYRYGIYAYSSDQNHIRNNVVSAGSNYGIHVNTGESNLIEYNNVSAGGTGIYIQNAGNANLIQYNIAQVTTNYGLSIYANSNSIARYNNLSASSTYTIYLGSSSNNISLIGNNVNSTGSGTDGYYIDSGENNTIDCEGANVIGSNTTSGYGIYSATINTTIKNCNVSEFHYGVYLNGDSADYTTIANNTFSSTYSGGIAIYATEADNTLAVGNNITSRLDTGYGINLVTNANNTTIEGNIIYNAYRPIRIFGANDEIIRNNTVINGTQYGIASSGSVTISNLTIVGNYLVNSGVGIWFNTNTDSSIIENNTIINQTTGTIISATSDNITLKNNTIINATTGVSLLSGGLDNFIYLNNITATTWISNEGSDGYFNVSGQGNIYYYANGTPIWDALNGLELQTTSPPNWADNGYGVNNTHFPDQWIGSGTDDRAWTENEISIAEIIGRIKLDSSMWKWATIQTGDITITWDGVNPWIWHSWTPGSGNKTMNGSSKYWSWINE